MSRNPRNKFETVRDLLYKSGAGRGTSLLDIGCRGCELRAYLPDGVRYVGVDLRQNIEGTVDYVLDVEKGLPFPDHEFEFVTALDVVEHLDDVRAGLKEMARVTRSCLIVLLPNMAFVTFRLDFLLHGRFAGTDKYDLTYEMGPDRHRWLTVLPQTDHYLATFAQDVGMRLDRSIYQESRAKEWFARVARFVGCPASWWTWKAMYCLSRP